MLLRYGLRLRNDEGNTLIIVILVSMVVGALASLALASGRQADWASASDRNHEQSLGAAEAGVHEEISRLQASSGGAYQTSFANIDSSLPQGSYHVETTRCPSTTHPDWCTGMNVTTGYVMDATGTTGVQIFKRVRHIRVSLIPPPLFPGSGQYALFSWTNVDLKNNDLINSGQTIPGDVWANQNVTLNNNANVNGSITAATGYIDTSAATVQGNVWSGGYNPNAPWALNLGTVGGWAKASVTAPTDPLTCGNQAASHYTVNIGSVTGNITTWGTISPGGRQSDQTNKCTAAAAAKPLPTTATCSDPTAASTSVCFTYNRNNYDPSTLHEFNTVADFNTWVGSHSVGAITGTFLINEPNPSWSSNSHYVDLAGWNIAGDVTIVSQAPIYTDGIQDTSIPPGGQAKLVIVSHYTPPPSSACDVNTVGSECAIYSKNALKESCLTAVLLYADNGPVGIKNNSSGSGGGSNQSLPLCGSVISQGIEIKNNQNLSYDPRLARVVGFGPDTYQIGRWEELPPS